MGIIRRGATNKKGTVHWEAIHEGGIYRNGGTHGYELGPKGRNMGTEKG